MKIGSNKRRTWFTKQTRQWLITAIVLALFFAVSGPAGAQQKQKGQENATMEQSQQTGTPYPLIGRDLITSRGENIGEVENVIVNYDGQVEKVIVDVGGFLGLGEKTVAISLDSLRLSKWNEAVYQGTEEDLEQMQEYEQPRRYMARQQPRYPYGPRGWDRYGPRSPYGPRGYAPEDWAYRPYYRSPMYGWGQGPYPRGYRYRGEARGEPRRQMPERGTRRGEQAGQEQQLQMSDVMGKTVYNRQGQEMGTVDDVIFSRDEDKVQVILDVGGLLGEDKRVSVPLRELEQRQGRLVCNICRADMEQEPGY